MKYILKDGREIESIPIGRSPMKIGETFNYLTILDRGPNTSGRKAMAICKCKCGNITLVPYSNVKDGHTKSCGCYNIEIHKELCKELGKQSYLKDYTNKDNPFYNFIEPTKEKDQSNSYYWIIECKQCKRRYKEVPVYLVSDTRRKGNNPCDCWRKTSKGVLKIKEILTKNNIKYETEKTFDTCLSPKNNLLKFDFYVNNNYLIEYDGEQHFFPNNFGSQQSDEERLTLQKEYDKIKNDWCKEHNIILIRIPYTKYNDLSLKDLQIETSNYVINGDK